MDGCTSASAIATWIFFSLKNLRSLIRCLTVDCLLILHEVIPCCAARDILLANLKLFRAGWLLVEYLLVNFNWMGNNSDVCHWRLLIHYYNKWRGDDNGMWFPMTMALFAHFISNQFLIQTMILDFSTILDIDLDSNSLHRVLAWVWPYLGENFMQGETRRM